MVSPLRALAPGASAAIAAALFLASAFAETPRVIDGDTLAYRSGKIRIWGLDCPESYTSAGQAATRAARELIEPNRIILERLDKDRYGRTVARVLIQRTSRGEFFTFDFACKMIQLGVCSEYVKFSNHYYTRCKP